MGHASARFLCAFLFTGSLALGSALPSTADLQVLDPPLISPQRQAAYEAPAKKSVLDLQRLRRVETGPVGGGTVALTHLNPLRDAWLLLELQGTGLDIDGAYHLENAYPSGLRVALAPAGLTLSSGDQARDCSLWRPGAPSPLKGIRADKRPYVPLCDGQLHLRVQTEGNRSTLEWATDLLRDHVWGGEQITNFVKAQLFTDAYLSTGEVQGLREPAAHSQPQGPLAAQVSPTFAGQTLGTADLGLSLDGAVGAKVGVGLWYPVEAQPGIYASLLQARMVQEAIVARQKPHTNPLEAVESGAIAYLVAFDLSQFILDFALGTDHPRVGWSERTPAQVRDPALPGPDGFDTLSPLARTGQVNPRHAQMLAATFTGGFKRSHGVFVTTELSQRHGGSHYGFVESGVILSKLRPGLATVVVWNDGRVEMKTWTEADDAHLWRVRHARQNGVPILEPVEAGVGVRVGPLVPRWREGNWSGSAVGRLRTVRAAACIQEGPEARYLLYGYFSSHTPSGLARLLEAYGCRYAMLLDMNALEHTYLATYRVVDGKRHVEHLVKGMEVLDKQKGALVLPRFVAFADNRDFFSLRRRERQ